MSRTIHADVRRVCEERGIKPDTGLQLAPLSADDVAAITSINGHTVSGVGIPYFDANGQPIRYGEEKSAFIRVKLLDEFWLNDKKDKEAKPRLAKYLQPTGSGTHIYFPRVKGLDFAAILSDVETELIITEGEFKAVAACQHGFPCIGLAGVWNWREKDDDEMPSLPTKELYSVAWSGRVVFIIFDADLGHNEQVYKAREELRTFLWTRGAHVYIVDLPVANDKVGLDDFLKTHGRAALRTLLDRATDGGLDAPGTQGYPHDLWGAPEVAPPLRRGMLPAALDAFAFASPQTLDPTALGFATIAACAMAASDNVRVRINETWLERACLWVALYGESGTGKSPVINAAAAPLEALSAKQSEDYAIKKADWGARKIADKNADLGPEPEREPRLLSHDATPAAASEVLKTTDHGIGIINDELSTVLASLDNARDSKHATERGPMLKLYDGGRNEIDRVMRGSVIVANWSASILGGVTTDLLAGIAKRTVADGMLPRCLLVQTQKLPPNPSLGSPEKSTYLAYKGIVRALVASRPTTPVEVALADEARSILGTAKMEWQQLASDVSGQYPRHAERINKLTGQAARLALMLMMIEACENPQRAIKYGEPNERAPQWTDITGLQMRRAVELLNLQVQHDRAFYRLQAKADVGAALALARQVGLWVLRERVTAFNQRSITHSLKAWTRDVDDRTKRDALVMLETLNWIGASNKRWYDYSGKIERGVQFTVNPLVHELFVARAEAARREAEAIKLTMTANFAQRRLEKEPRP